MFENKIKKKKNTRKIASYFLVVFVQKRKILEFFSVSLESLVL